MRKQSILTITTTLSLILLSFSCWFISCRKSQQEVFPEFVEDNTDKVSAISQNRDLLSLLAAKVEKQINESRVSENITTVAGQPNWEQSLVVEKNDASSRSKKKTVKAIVYTPFVKKNEHKTAAILRSTVYETDTTFLMLYPQSYLQYGFGDHSDTAWNAYDLFNIFASFDYSLYGTSQYIVTDGRIFGKREKDTLLVTRQSRVVSNIANGREVSSGSKLQAISICTTWTSCVYGIDGATGSSSCRTTETCTTYWIEIGDGGGGSTTPGTTAGGGGTAGTPSNNPTINGSPCATPTVARYNVRAAEVSPCPEPWKPADGLKCNSFAFNSTATNWQEAGIKNLKCNIWWIGGNKSGTQINITLKAPVIFGLPTERLNGDEYTPGRAANLSAEAVTNALTMTTQLLKYEPVMPSNVVIEETFRKWINIFMNNYGGTAGRTGSRSPGIIIKDASYQLLGSGDCE